MTHGVIATQSMTWRTALKQVQTEKPAYESGAEGWWGEVIKRTAIGAGADPQCKWIYVASVASEQRLECYQVRVTR